MAKETKPYMVAPGSAITILGRKMATEGQVVKVDQLSGGEKAYKDLINRKILVPYVETETQPEEKDDEK